MYFLKAARIKRGAFAQSILPTRKKLTQVESTALCAYLAAAPLARKSFQYPHLIKGDFGILVPVYSKFDPINQLTHGDGKSFKAAGFVCMGQSGAPGISLNSERCSLYSLYISAC